MLSRSKGGGDPVVAEFCFLCGKPIEARELEFAFRRGRAVSAPGRSDLAHEECADGTGVFDGEDGEDPIEGQERRDAVPSAAREERTMTNRDAAPSPAVDIKRVLVPVDFSEAVPVLVRYAMEIVRGRGAVIRLFHVLESPVTATLPPSDAALVAACSPDVVAAIETRMAALRSGIRGLKVETRVVLGAPAREILREAKEWEADIVVVATHGRTGLKRAFLGSVAEEVVRRSACPVLTVRNSRVRAEEP